MQKMTGVSYILLHQKQINIFYRNAKNDGCLLHFIALEINKYFYRNAKNDRRLLHFFFALEINTHILQKCMYTAQKCMSIYTLYFILYRSVCPLVVQSYTIQDEAVSPPNTQEIHIFKGKLCIRFARRVSGTYSWRTTRPACNCGKGS